MLQYLCALGTVSCNTFVKETGFVDYVEYSSVLTVQNMIHIAVSGVPFGEFDASQPKPPPIIQKVLSQRKENR